MSPYMFLSSEKELNFQEHAIPLYQKAWKKNVHLTKFKLFACLFCAFDKRSNYFYVCLTKVQTFCMLVWPRYQIICMFVLCIWPRFKLFACLSKVWASCQRLPLKNFTDSQYGYCPLAWMFRGRNANLTINHVNDETLRMVHRNLLLEVLELANQYLLGTFKTHFSCYYDQP